MAGIREQPLLTTVAELDNFVPERGSAYVFGISGEERSAHSEAWQSRAVDVQFLRIVDQNRSDFTAEMDGTIRKFFLRSRDQLANFWRVTTCDLVYLDITGLSHHVWAPLLRSAIVAKRRVVGVYVEPGDYRPSSTPTESEIFDLSERIEGIAPIPGFASLVGITDRDSCFVPLLGFEGTRLAYLLEAVQPEGNKIVPIIGVPGFRPEYPFYTYQGNRAPLLETRAWRNVRFAQANCPFSLFYALQDIVAAFPRDLIKIAPIGTKPHALGAVLFAMASSRPVELVYDHPIRKSTRTAGTSRILLYELSVLLSTGMRPS
ncbi:MAG TPA: hypothetical protein VHA33_09130 [Candidatus Angelobacter sp.]|jgi:hypothetical protein|nr:hypothetical protein [Candidatus Angelobacter sp.]